MIRSSDGNMPNVLQRIAAYQAAVHGVVKAGLADRHNGSPAACLKAEAMYATPVLLSGIASLTLTEGEVGLLQASHTSTLRMLQKLPSKSPRAAVHILAGVPPLLARIHQRQLSLLYMIARLGPKSILYKHGMYCLTHSVSHSWFCLLRLTCSTYYLPDPVLILCTPPSKFVFKKKVKCAISSFWHNKLRQEASSLTSLLHLKFDFIPLLDRPHFLWTSAGHTKNEVKAARVQATMLSGRYQTDKLRRHWTGNSEGLCSLPGCVDTTTNAVGDLCHLLLGPCNALSDLHMFFLKQLQVRLSSVPPFCVSAIDLLRKCDNNSVHFVLDPGTTEIVRGFPNPEGKKFLLPILYQWSRNIIWAVHARRLRLLGLQHCLMY